MSRQSPKPPGSIERSKPALRTSKEQTQAQAQAQPPTQPTGLGLLPSPSFDILPRTASPKTVGFDDAVLHADGAVEQQSFQPFFALVYDGSTSEHYHPTVHYVFADDEEGGEVVSEGVVRALRGLEASAEKEEGMGREHVLILDVDAKLGGQGGYEVTQAQSLSAEWQIGTVDVMSAPTMSEEDGGAGLMLRIEGRGPAVDDDGFEIGRESLEGMVGRYQRGLEEIRKMAALGEEGEG